MRGWKITVALLLWACAICSCAKEHGRTPSSVTETSVTETTMTGTIEAQESSGTDTQQTSAAQTTAAAMSPIPQAPPEKNITIDAVEMGNPIIVTGRARTFENNVSLRLRDQRGALIIESFTTATGEMGQHSPYRGSLWITRDPGASITVQALEYSARDGSEQSLVALERPFAVQAVPARLFFPDRNCISVRPYTRRIPKSISAARLLVEALMAGPTAQERTSGAEGPFPRGSSLQSVNLRDGTLTVDFNERLRNVGGACAATMIRRSVTETLRSLPAVKKVVITAGGSESLALQP